MGCSTSHNQVSLDVWNQVMQHTVVGNLEIVNWLSLAIVGWIFMAIQFIYGLVCSIPLRIQPVNGFGKTSEICHYRIAHSFADAVVYDTCIVDGSYHAQAAHALAETCRMSSVTFGQFTYWKQGYESFYAQVRRE